MWQDLGALTTKQENFEWAVDGLSEAKKIEVDRVAVIKFRVNNGGGDGTSCFKIKIGGLRTDAAKLNCFRQ